MLLTSLLLNIFLLFSKGYSPQYLTWLIPCMAILATGRSIWLLFIAGLVVANLIEYPIYFHFFPKTPWVLILAVGVRTLLLVFASLLQWQNLVNSGFPKRVGEPSH
jgi:hypothetical protein